MPKKTTPKKAAKSPAPKTMAVAPYVVLARKYRPQTFEDLIGQSALVVTLQNAFEAGRIAQAYMLTGVRGVGKTTTARILARALNFARDGAPDQPTTQLPRADEELGRHCADIMESRHPDVIEMDAASNTGVDNVREIIESARYKPLIARYKVFIIDEVHMLSKGAFNALLKTLEEPPEHVKFIFATTEIRKVPVTVLSRCQRFDLRRVDTDDLVAHFTTIVEKEGASAEADALRLIARAAEGSVRDGLSILDQAIAFQEGTIGEAGVRAMLGLADRSRIFQLLENTLSGNTKAALERAAQLHKDGCEPARVLTDLGEVVHLITKTKAVGEALETAGLPTEDLNRANALAKKLSVPLLARTWQMLLKGIEETQRASLPMAAAEMVLIRIAHTADLPTPDDLIKAFGPGTAATKKSHDSAPQSAPNEPARANAHSSPSAQSSPASQTPATSQPPNEPPPWQPDESNTAPTTAPPLEEAPPTDNFTDFDSDPAEQDVAATHLRPNPRNFDEVLKLVGEKRDARLKVHLEEHTSLVNFDTDTNAIDLYLYPGAPKSVAKELREKLNEWTGTRWIVVLSKTEGAPPVAQVTRKKFEQQIEDVKADPAVKAALEAFPDARITDISPLSSEQTPGENEKINDPGDNSETGAA